MQGTIGLPRTRDVSTTFPDTEGEGGTTRTMCGIAGYSMESRDAFDAERLLRVLVATVADRGDDSAGVAWLDDDSQRVSLIKQPGGASQLLATRMLPDLAPLQAIAHVRDHTKGRPSLPANNHPIRHGAIVGVHNGRIANDERVFAELQRQRAEAGMTVDSEAIFARLDAIDDAADALAGLRGSIATCWFDERRPDSVYLARGRGRPLWVAHSDHGLLVWASTLEALELVEEFLRLRLRKRPVPAGTLLEIRAGQIVQRTRWQPDDSASWLRNPVVSRPERERCLTLVAG